MNNPLDVSPSKGNQGTTRGKEKNLLTSVGIEPTASGLDLLVTNRGRSVSNGSNGRSNPEVVGSIPTEVKRFFLYLAWFPDSLY